MKSMKAGMITSRIITYVVLGFFALVMLFPFAYMLTGSFKTTPDMFTFPPRLLPRDPIFLSVEGYEDPLPLYEVEYEGEQTQFVLVERGIRVAYLVDPASPEEEMKFFLSDLPEPLVDENGDEILEELNGEQVEVYAIEKDGQIVNMLKARQTALGRFEDPVDSSRFLFQNVRTSTPSEELSIHPENYERVLDLQGMYNSLTNTALVTILVVLGQLTTSILGGYAFSRIRFPGRNKIFLFYLATYMIPFIILIIPLYNIMVMLGWRDTLTSLVIPWVFTVYGTFLMRQFFMSIPKELEEAAFIDGASRMMILRKIFLPAITPALATLATFTFLYAWNSFVWPLIIINTGNVDNHVLTLSLNMLRGRAMDSPNLILAGASIAILPPLIVFIVAQRYYLESIASSGVKG